ncbi:tetratricopeptide repeat protein [Shewanella vesiculosa]|nr:tetratricopeptide repeat protein [Shewanella vesiculosa]UJL41203.1 tetratricopeptide repeat protein [Shewanella vesiculosa]
MSIIDQYLSQAESLFQSKNYSSARMYARKVVKRDDKHVGALAILGHIHLQQQQYAQAESYFISAASIKPNTVSVLMGLLTIAEVKQDFFLSKAYLEQLINLLPQDAKCRYKLGLVATKVGDMTLAEQCFQWCVWQMILLNPLCSLIWVISIKPKAIQKKQPIFISNIFN